MYFKYLRVSTIEWMGGWSNDIAFEALDFIVINLVIRWSIARVSSVSYCIISSMGNSGRLGTLGQYKRATRGTPMQALPHGLHQHGQRHDATEQPSKLQQWCEQKSGLQTLIASFMDIRLLGFSILLLNFKLCWATNSLDLDFLHFICGLKK